MFRFLTTATVALVAGMCVLGGAYVTASAQVPMGPYFQTLQADNSIADSIERGKQIFNQLGCGGCHPRGGTIGGTALNVAGQRVPVPIPALKGAALHYPRQSMTGFAATIGIMNDL